MLFTGQSQHSIDSKLRLSIPARFRSQWKPSRDGEAWICIPWPTGHLRLYTEARFTELAEQGSGSANSLTPAQDEASLESVLYGFAERLEEDKAGRITIPRSHLELAGIGTDVVVVGARFRLEVHDRAAWEATAKENLKRLPELIDRVQSRRGQQPPPPAPPR